MKIYIQQPIAIFYVQFAWSHMIVRFHKKIISYAQFVKIINSWHGVENVFVMIINKFWVLTKDVVINYSIWNILHLFDFFLVHFKINFFFFRKTIYLFIYFCKYINILANITNSIEKCLAVLQIVYMIIYVLTKITDICLPISSKLNEIS